MADFSLSDLAALPTPEIIETLAYEDILSARKATYVTKTADYGLPSNVTNLETDPSVALLEEGSYDELILRARGNDIARSRYLYYARDSEVDHLGLFYDCTRLTGELDTPYKNRIILAIKARSTGGTEARYKLLALSSSLRVADAKVYTTGTDPTVNIAVFAADNNGVADATLLALVSAAVNAVNARMINDTIAVKSAVVLVQDVAYDLWLLPNADQSLLTTLAANLPGQWAAEGGLGRDLTVDWLKSKLVLPGVYKATPVLPLADVIMTPDGAVRLGNVTLNFAGRAY